MYVQRHLLLFSLLAVYDRDRSGTLDKTEWEKVTRWHITRKKDAMVVEGSFHRCDANHVCFPHLFYVAACCIMQASPPHMACLGGRLHMSVEKYDGERQRQREREREEKRDEFFFINSIFLLLDSCFYFCFFSTLCDS
jgi:hypothetical protein